MPKDRTFGSGPIEEEFRAKMNTLAGAVDELSLQSHPERREVLWISAEDYVSGTLMGMRYILRPEHGKPTLSPLKISGRGESSGRFVNFLEPRDAGKT